MDLLRRLRYLLRRSRLEAELREEMETHRLLRQAQLEREGLAAEDAARASKLQFGQASIARDDVADLWTASLDGWRQDLRHAVKSVTTRRGFALTAVLTLALCVGANLVVFTIVNALWLRPRAVAEPERVVMLLSVGESGDRDNGFGTNPLALPEHAPEFQAVAGQVKTSDTAKAHNTPRVWLPALRKEVETLAVSSQYFRVVGLPIRGRDFSDNDDVRGAAMPVAIMSDRLWRNAFRASPEVIGAEIEALPIRLRIIGIAPPGFHGVRLGEQFDLWVPRHLTPQVSVHGLGDRDPSMLLLARLQPRITAAQAERAFLEWQASRGRGDRYRVLPANRLYGSPSSRTLFVGEQRVVAVAAAMAVLVLLAGCATLMALVLVHYERRRQELAIRLALGCSRRRLIRALALEVVALGVLGGAAACAISQVALRALPSLSLPGGLDLSRIGLDIDWTVAAFAIGATAVSLLIATGMPVRRSTRPTLVDELVSVSSRATPSTHRLRGTILAVHVAATIVVLAGAGLFVQTVVRGFTTGPGYDVDRLLIAELRTRGPMTRLLSEAEEAERDARTAVRLGHVFDVIRARPEVESIAVGESPISATKAREWDMPRVWLTGERSVSLQAPTVAADPEYFQTLGTRLIAGRNLAKEDVRLSGSGIIPVVITRSFAEALWPDQSPVGQHFSEQAVGWRFEVVGMASDVAAGSQRFENRAALFYATDLPSATTRSDVGFVVRATRDPADVVEPVREAIATEFPTAPVVNIRTAREIVAEDLGRERLGAWFFSGFGVVALALGIGGVFGLVAYLAESRRRELGVRLALGAQHGQIARLLIGAGIRPVAVGTAIGLVAAALVVQLVESAVYGIRDVDASAFVVAAGLMLGGSALAGVAAAWRAHRIAPSEALRAE